VEFIKGKPTKQPLVVCDAKLGMFRAGLLARLLDRNKCLAKRSDLLWFVIEVERQTNRMVNHYAIEVPEISLAHRRGENGNTMGEVQVSL
jgi:hypothetical protein